MRTRLNTAQPVLSQQLARSSATPSLGIADLRACCMRQIISSNWIGVVAGEKETSDPFLAVGHQNGLSSLRVHVREADSEYKPIGRASPGDRCHARGRLVRFKKQG